MWMEGTRCGRLRCPFLGPSAGNQRARGPLGPISLRRQPRQKQARPFRDLGALGKFSPKASAIRRAAELSSDARRGDAQILQSRFWQLKKNNLVPDAKKPGFRWAFAEGTRFELVIRFPVCRFSKPVVSATHPPLLVVALSAKPDCKYTTNFR